MQRIGEKLLGEVLKEYVRESGLAERMQGLDVCDVWNQAVGPRVAAATRDIYFRDGILYCRMSSSSVRNMLYYNLPGIISTINSRLPGAPLRKIVLR